MSHINVTKRDGLFAPLDIEKIHGCIEWAAKGLKNVSVSQVALKSHLQFYDGIKTSDIHEIVIKAAADLISVECPDYAIMAARLTIIHIRKKAYGEYTPPNLVDHVTKIVGLGKYDNAILVDYSTQELQELGDYIDHERDLNFAYAAVKQLEGKYLVQNRVTKQIFESPQFAYMLIGACLFSQYENKEERMGYVKRFYDAASQFRISLPTPIMGGVRTPTRQFSSCVLIDCDDSLDSINASASAIVKYVSQRAGIGINGGKIRALGSEIRGGEALHTGVIPFYKHFQTAVKSCSQGGIRGGAATLFYPLWHLEVESLLVLKNNRGVEENRVRHLDYAVQFNKLMYQRLIKDQHITLFSPSDVPGLYEAFFADQELFETLYVKYENDPSIRQKQIKAIELFSMFMQERASTGRIYLQNVDHCNTHSPFDASVAPIKQSNLCLEIALPTKPLKNIEDESGEIALCTLAAFNATAYDLTTEEGLALFNSDADLIVRALDALLDYQDYPIKAARKSSMGRRTLGIGIVNFAHKLAKNGLKYSDGSANNLTHRFFEQMQFNLMTASVNLAKEKGACDLFHETKLSKGILPIDTYKREIDKITSQELLCDWEGLRDDILKYGMRNSTLSALMPSETSSQVLNATNGIEPPRGPISIKSSKDGVLKQVVPDVDTLADNYEFLWSIPSNKGYLELCGIMQKFVDQTISANTSYDPNKYEGGKVPMKLLLQDMLSAYRLGVKTLYYHNTRDGASDTMEDTKEDDCTGGACKI